MTAVPPPNESDLWQPNRSRSKRIQMIVQIIFGAFALVSVATTIGIVLTLIFETIAFFQEVPFIRFITETRWTPLFSSAQFGIIVLISATLRLSAVAILVALPLGLLAAIYMSEYASPNLRKTIKPALEILAGVPSVVFGYFALLFVSPLLRTDMPAWVQSIFPGWEQLIPDLQGFNGLSAGLVLGISITPLVASLSEDAIYAVPRSLKDGAYALGSTKRETIISVVLPAALSGIVSALILAISRAIGETMIVTLAAGQNPNFGIFELREPMMAMTAFIVQVSLGDTPVGSIAYLTIFAVGMTLFLMTLALNIFSFWFVRRFREKYE